MKTNKGFTLIELIIVVVTLGLLATIITINVQKAQEKSKEVVCRPQKQEWMEKCAMHSDFYGCESRAAKLFCLPVGEELPE